ncbi:hypothetical protein [Streptomyces sp. CA-132043]|uniref:hypothetical protein n=1 Tax=Streptomyces sp. CA-132043 TaxID=3240048 RepID=UPI003D8AF3DE
MVDLSCAARRARATRPRAAQVRIVCRTGEPVQQMDAGGPAPQHRGDRQTLGTGGPMAGPYGILTGRRGDCGGTSTVGENLAVPTSCSWTSASKAP